MSTKSIRERAQEALKLARSAATNPALAGTFHAVAREDMPTLAAALLRLTGEEMRERLESVLVRAMEPCLKDVLSEEEGGVLLYHMLDGVTALIREVADDAAAAAAAGGA